MVLKMLGQKIKTARKEAKLRQEDLADMVGTTKSVISEYETGKRNISVKELEKISFALGRTLRIDLD